MSTDSIRRWSEAQSTGARHLARLHRARYALSTGDLEGGPFPGERPLILVPRRKDAAGTPVAFLASFAGQDFVFPLKHGLNRVGYDKMFGDYDKPAPTAPIESRQWILVVHDGGALVMSDRSTNPSTALPASVPRLDADLEPRFGEGPYFFNMCDLAAPGAIKLDWAGTTVHALAEGDALLSPYQPFVFGWIPSSQAS
jgi:hypothetical protein